MKATHPWKVGDRVQVAPSGRNDWVAGTVTGVDEPGLPKGVRIQLDRLVNGVDNCYASHAELERHGPWFECDRCGEAFPGEPLQRGDRLCLRRMCLPDTETAAMSSPFDPKPDICDANCFYEPGHDGPHQKWLGAPCDAEGCTKPAQWRRGREVFCDDHSRAAKRQAGYEERDVWTDGTKSGWRPISNTFLGVADILQAYPESIASVTVTYKHGAGLEVRMRGGMS